MKREIAELVSKVSKLPKKEVENLIEIPPSQELGDYAFPTFVLARKLKKSPIEIAEELTENLRKKLPKFISGVDAKGSYVNFFLDKKILAKDILAEPFSIPKKTNKKTVIEFSQPNTHKAFHVGHIRGTSIGESLSRIFEFSGDRVTRVNYSGDTGMHVAKWIWCYQKYHSKERLREDETWIAGIYVDAVKRLSKNEKLQSEVEEINRKLESGKDKELDPLWEKTRKASLKSLEKIYKDLNTKFDKHYFESQMETEAKKIANELLKKGIAKKDDAVFMDLEKYSLGIWVLLRKDGTVLYSAKDLALAKRKVKDFPADQYLLAVADEQRMYTQQLIKTLELMKFPKAKNYKAMTFGLVRFPEGKMSSRTGQNVLYSEFLKRLIDKAKKPLKGKNTNEKAKKVAIAAIKYSMLKQDPRKMIIFDPNEAVSFEGDTGPYLLYSYARANSILKKVKSKNPVKIVDLKDQEIKLLKKIATFQEIVKAAYDNLAPNLVANYAFELSKIFNEFYHACPVKGSVEEAFRLKLVSAFRTTLGKSLDLLGIDVLEEM